MRDRTPASGQPLFPTSSQLTWRGYLPLTAELVLVENFCQSSPRRHGHAFSGKFRAFDKDTGDELWVTKLPASGMATPMTYLGKKTGKQFVVIAAGGGNKYDKKFTLDSPYSAFASSSRCFSNWAVHVATGPRTVPNTSPVS